MIDFDLYKAITFDCYGTLIDWEEGILSVLKPVFSLHRIRFTDKQILELFAELELKAESEEFVPYRDILKKVMKGISAKFGFNLSDSELICLENSMRNWLPYSDTVESLMKLRKKFNLAIISNVDDDLIAHSINHLKIDFDWIITSEQIKSYKPSSKNFDYTIKKLNVPVTDILHVAQSIYHDIIPARKADLATVWVNRRKGTHGFGATPPAKCESDLEVPDLKTLTLKMRL